MEGEQLNSSDLHSSRILHQACLGLLILVFGLGCERQSKVDMSAPHKKSPISYHAEGKHHRLGVVIGGAEVNTLEGNALDLKDSIRIDILRPDNRPWARIRANSGISLPPYDEAILHEFIWETEDGTEISGTQFTWTKGKEFPIQIPGEVELATDEGLVLGEGLKGDLLLRRYEIQKVTGVVNWDELAGDSLQSPQ